MPNGEFKGSEKRNTKNSTHGHESSDFLSIFDQLHTHTLANGGVGLFCLDTDFLQYNPLCVGGASSGRGLVDVAEGTFFVGFVRLFMKQNREKCSESDSLNGD